MFDLKLCKTSIHSGATLPAKFWMGKSMPLVG